MKGKERRRSKRLEKRFSVFYRVYTKTELVGDISQIKDISQGGTCIITNQEMSVGDLLELIVRIPYDVNRKIKLYGEVLEVKPRPYSLEYETRVSFIDIDEQTKNFLRDSIEVLSDTDKPNS
jgi:Tfp pilus assembly protein PilZ